jgi:hypothetical protein
MRAYDSHENAGRRLDDRRQQRNNLELEDLLRYLEDVSSEPSGNVAYRLALKLRSMQLTLSNFRDLVHNAAERLSSHQGQGDAHPTVCECLANLTV